MMLTDKELQSLRNLGNEAEAAADEIERAWAARDAAVADLEAHAASEVRRAVAAERERWAEPVQALLAAHDASMLRLGEMMRANGVTTMRIDGAAQAELEAIEALRGLVGPN